MTAFIPALFGKGLPPVPHCALLGCRVWLRGSRHIARHGDPPEDEAPGRRHPRTGLSGFVPTKGRTAGQEKGQGEHHAKRPRLAGPTDVDPGGARQRQSAGSEQHQRFSQKDKNDEPHRHGAHGQSADYRGQYQQPVSEGVGHLAERRHLVEVPGYIAVETVGDTKAGE